MRVGQSARFRLHGLRANHDDHDRTENDLSIAYLDERGHDHEPVAHHYHTDNNYPCHDDAAGWRGCRGDPNTHR